MIYFAKRGRGREGERERLERVYSFEFSIFLR
jgi:hypothetical protein